MTKKKVYSPEFKAKVVRELVEGDDSVGVVAARHHLNANMVSGWRRQLFDNAEVIFAQDQTIRQNTFNTDMHTRHKSWCSSGVNHGATAA